MIVFSTRARWNAELLSVTISILNITLLITPSIMLIHFKHVRITSMQTLAEGLTFDSQLIFVLFLIHLS